MDSSFSYPPIDPTSFDLIVVGTGLPESILASAASSAGKTVLHLDPNPFYGSLFSSLSLHDTVSFLQQTPLSPPTTSSIDSDFTVVDLTTAPLISHPDISPVPPELLHCGRFSLDVSSGPRVLFCADSAVNLMIRSGISEYLDFKCVDASYVYDAGNANANANARLVRVPGSRSEIFKDRSLGLKEKRQLMNFFKLVQNHMESDAISPHDLEKPFAEFLGGMEMPVNMKSIILYAIAMADDDQEVDAGNPLLKTNEAMTRLALYLSSIGRFPNTTSGMLYPMYGHGEVPQAFCRRAAVKGCIYVLRMPVVALLVEKDSGLYKGIKLGSGQLLFSQQLVLDPCFKIPSSLDVGSPQGPKKHLKDHSPRERKVARGICITRKSVKSEGSNLLVVYPPRSLNPQQATSVRALQIGSNVAVCPSDMFVLYLSTPCDDASEGKKSIRAAIKALFATPDQETPESSSTLENSCAVISEDAEDDKPNLLWSAIYVQEVLEGSSHQSVMSAPSPDTNLSCNDLADATIRLFHEMYPDAELFPETPPSNNSEEEDGPFKDEEQPTQELSIEPSS